MNELLKIEISEKQEQVISGRALHMFLDIETPYTMWFERMLQYGFCNGKDFLTKMLESHRRPPQHRSHNKAGYGQRALYARSKRKG